MDKLKEFKWSIVALALLLVGVLLSRGGLASLLPLARLLAPVILVLVAFHFVKKRLTGGAIGQALKARMEEAMRQQQMHTGAGRGKDKVIDLCPKCGSYLAPGHRCKK